MTGDVKESAPTHAEIASQAWQDWANEDYVMVLDFIDTVAPNAVEVFHELVDTGRWMSYEFTVYKLEDGSHVGIAHSEGLTENQESEGVTDVYPVRAHVIETIAWRRDG